MTRKRRLNCADLFINEIVNCGGFPMRRCEVRRLQLMLGFTQREADAAAFAYCSRLEAERGAMGMSAEEVLGIMRP